MKCMQWLQENNRVHCTGVRGGHGMYGHTYFFVNKRHKSESKFCQTYHSNMPHIDCMMTQILLGVCQFLKEIS